MSSICILGRQPAIGLAELESLYGSSRVKPIGKEAAHVDLTAEQIAFSRLGGTMKLCKSLTILPTVKWQDIHEYLVKTIPGHLQHLPEGKLQLGLSVYGIRVSSRELQTSGLTLKKMIRGHGRSVRLIPNQEPALNSAQVLHNHLTGKLGWEFVIVKDGEQAHLAQTIAVQDINAYAARDQARPMRDARVGMLPPKLAQIIINLAHPASPQKFNSQHVDNRPTAKSLSGLLDPFCGTGVLLQEALLMGFSVIGSDIDQRMIEYSGKNLLWLRQTHDMPASATSIFPADATEYTWPIPFYAIAAETYLGRPFSASPKPEILAEVIQDVDTIHKKFLRNIVRQTKTGFRMCLAIPAWKVHHGFKHLPILDHLGELGYTRVSFVNTSNADLIYHRPNQIVARELVVLIRK